MTKIIPLCQLLIISTIFIFSPLDTVLFRCLFEGNKSHQPMAIESGDHLEERLVLESEHKPKVAPENDIEEELKNRNALLEEDASFEITLLVQRLDQFVLKPLLIRDYEKRKVHIEVHS